MIHLIKKITILYLILVIVFTSLLTLAYSLPTNSIKRNVAISALQIEKEGIWWKPLGFYLFQIDNMTDCIMLGTSICNNQKSNLKAAMLAERATPNSNLVTDFYLKITTYTYQDATNTHRLPYLYTNYARYWHGYQIILKPLLCIFNYQQIRIINYVIFFTLTVFVILLLYRKIGLYAALTFGITLAICNIFIVPLAIQFSTCFYIAFFSMIIFLKSPNWTHSSSNQTLIYFSIGAITSYLDLLTTPIITLALPLIVILLTQSITCKKITMLSVSWGTGYTLLWITKWMLAWLFTGCNILDDAIRAAELRVGNTIYFGGTEITFLQFFQIIWSKAQSFLSSTIWLTFVLVSIICITWVIIRNIQFLKKEKYIVCIMSMPLLWFIILKNHSIQHIFFTWRDWVITLWCILILLYKRQQYKKKMI